MDTRAQRMKTVYGEGGEMSDLAKERVILLPRNTYGSCFITVIEVESPNSSVSYESLYSNVCCYHQNK